MQASSLEAEATLTHMLLKKEKNHKESAKLVGKRFRQLREYYKKNVTYLMFAFWSFFSYIHIFVYLASV